MNTEITELRVRLLRAGALAPQPGSDHAIGADLCCIDSFTLQPGDRRLIPTGLSLEIPPGYYGRVAPRSGLALKHGIDTLAGVIDPDYRGELQVLLINLGQDPVSFDAGARIAQLIIERAAQTRYLVAENLSDTSRGEGGFGSTGV
ncbi:MAG: dUTP diphosphatase [Blastocatellia bacterium]